MNVGHFLGREWAGYTFGMFPARLCTGGNAIKLQEELPQVWGDITTYRPGVALHGYKRALEKITYREESMAN